MSQPYVTYFDSKTFSSLHCSYTSIPFSHQSTFYYKEEHKHFLFITKQSNTVNQRKIEISIKKKCAEISYTIKISCE